MKAVDFGLLRWKMVQIVELYVQHSSAGIGRNALDSRVLAAMGKVPRHEFVPAGISSHAYNDGPLPIGFDKTVSQPFIAALMTDLLDVQPGDRVLEVGAGLGYHSALLVELGAEVCSIEIIEELAEQAQANLKRTGYDSIALRIGDGSRGWPEHAPFDRILVAAAAEPIPPALLQQIAPGGRMVIPTGMPDSQTLTLVEKDGDGRIRTRDILPVRFAQLETYH